MLPRMTKSCQKGSSLKGNNLLIELFLLRVNLHCKGETVELISLKDINSLIYRIHLRLRAVLWACDWTVALQDYDTH